MTDASDAPDEHRRASAFRPVLVAWMLTVGVDLFFNAGLFSGLFEQSREPSLLADEVLFRRIPVAYLGLAVGVTALAWLIDRLGAVGMRRGAALGAGAGVVVAFLGVIGLWTAIDITGVFVWAAVLVHVLELGLAGGFLGAYRAAPDGRRSIRIALIVSVALAVLGIVIQNLLPG